MRVKERGTPPGSVKPGEQKKGKEDGKREVIQNPAESTGTNPSHAFGPRQKKLRKLWKCCG